jgi:hypothetical protein
MLRKVRLDPNGLQQIDILAFPKPCMHRFAMRQRQWPASAGSSVLACRFLSERLRSRTVALRVITRKDALSQKRIGGQMRNGLMGLAGVLSFAATMGVVGCGSDEGDNGGDAEQPVAASSCTKSSGGTMVTNFCGSAALNTLTAAETTQLCTETGDFVTAAISRPTGCKFRAIVFAASNSSPTNEQMQAACAATEASCNDDSSIPGPGGETSCSQIPPTCTATIEQYSACMADQAVVFEQQANALTSCSTLTFANLSTVYDVATAANAAAGCMALKTACPTFNLPYIN